MNRFISATLILLLFLITACKEAKSPHQIPKEVLEKPFHLTIKRFDKDLFALKGDTTEKKLTELANAYPSFFYLFTSGIINIGDSLNPALKIRLQDFLQDKYIQEMYGEVLQKFNHVNEFNQELIQAFAGYHYHFPERRIPQIVYFVSGYNYANVTTTDVLGIGLEMYLGASHKPYELLEIPAYKRKLLCKEFIVHDALQAWMSTELENKDDENMLLQQMLFKAKVLYALSCIMPETPDTIRFGYSAKELEWCKDNEKNIWSYFIEKQLLFAPMRNDCLRFINEGPFTPGFPRESPGKLGVWLGYRIIQKYVEKNPKISLNKLFNNHDARQILSVSAYKPK